MNPTTAVFQSDERRNWARHGRAFAAGTAFIDNVPHNSAGLAKLADEAGGKGELPRLLRRLNGFYAVCYAAEDGGLTAAVDRARSIPMFYATSGSTLLVSDNAAWIKEQVGARQICREHATDLLMTAFVTGRHTLFAEISQLQLGEMLMARPDGDGWKLALQYHFHFHHENSRDTDLQSQESRLRESLASAVARLTDYAGGRQILLALSGGLDSAMIGLELARQGYDDVRAFTYGSRYSREVLHSRDVAAALDLPWKCHRYTPELWREWLGSADRREYWNRTHHFASLPHVQDAMAIRGMLDSGFASSDAVVVTGQSVEGFYGIQFGPEDWAALQAPGFEPRVLADIIYRLHYRLWPGEALGHGVRELMLSQIMESLGDAERYGTPTSYFEAWVVREKDAKFNTNSMRAYEHYGLDWWLPLYDAEIIEFWTQLPSQLRHGRAFTRRFVANLFRDITGAEYDYRGGHSGYERAARTFRPLMWRGGLAAAVYVALKREMKYSRDRMGWHQIIPRRLYRRLFHFRFNINSLLVLELLGALDLGLGRPLLRDVDLPPELLAKLEELCRP